MKMERDETSFECACGKKYHVSVFWRTLKRAAERGYFYGSLREGTAVDAAARESYAPTKNVHCSCGLDLSWSDSESHDCTTKYAQDENETLVGEDISED